MAVRMFLTPHVSIVLLTIILYICEILHLDREKAFDMNMNIIFYYTQGFEIGISKLDLYEKITTTAYHPVSDYCALILFFYLEAEIMAHAKS